MHIGREYYYQGSRVGTCSDVSDDRQWLLLDRHDVLNDEQSKVAVLLTDPELKEKENGKNEEL